MVPRGVRREKVESPRDQGDGAGDFVVGSDDTVDSVVASYRAAVDRSRRIAAGIQLETLSAGCSQYREHVSLRWIFVHMLEETARHAGHLDLMREEIDGRTGD